MDNPIVIGKRIPIGTAINGVILFGADLWNKTHPDDVQLSLTVVAGLAVSITALAQVLVVNYYGVTNAKG